MTNWAYRAESLAYRLERLGLTVFIDRSRSTHSQYLDVVRYTDETEDEVEQEWTVRMSDHPPRPNFRGRYPDYDFEVGPYPDAGTNDIRAVVRAIKSQIGEEVAS